MSTILFWFSSPNHTASCIIFNCIAVGKKQPRHLLHTLELLGQQLCVTALTQREGICVLQEYVAIYFVCFYLFQSLSHVRLFETPWTPCQSSLSMGFFRQEYWSGLPFSSQGDLPNPGIETGSPALQADASTSEPPGKPLRLLQVSVRIHFSITVTSDNFYQAPIRVLPHRCK